MANGKSVAWSREKQSVTPKVNRGELPSHKLLYHTKLGNGNGFNPVDSILLQNFAVAAFTGTH